MKAAAIGLWAAAVVFAPNLAISAALAAPLLLIPLTWWLLSRANHWIAAFLASALLLPPLPVALGNTGPHPALLFAAAGGWIGALRLREWNLRLDTVSRSMLLFFVILLASTGCAAIYSGPEIAAGSLARVLLFGISVYLFLYAMRGPGAHTPIRTATIINWLLVAAVLQAAFACFDFYFQLPAPAGYGAQFVWLDTGILRRAQGLFYEASTLGNFCTFFLVMIAVVASMPREQRIVSRFWLAIAGATLSAALVFSYSRASIIALLCALLALVYLRRSTLRLQRWLWLLPLCLLAGAALVSFLFPQFGQAYIIRMKASVEFFFDEPNRILSGRLESWRTLLHTLLEHPWYLLTGIGYKTLPYTDLVGAPIVADNMYLSLLIETGIPGLLAFLWMNLQILLTSFRSAVRSNIFGTWIFCFWVGEVVQMLSGDLFTYWRVLPLYFWVLACATRIPPNERPVS